MADTKLRAAVPVLLRVIAWVAAVVPTVVLAKVRLEDERLTTGAGVTPVPLRATFCGELAALSLMLTAAVSAPAPVGLNVTVILQLAPAATVLPQVLVWLNELALVPVIEMATPLGFNTKLKAALPVLLRVIAWVAAVAPTVVLAKVSGEGERLATGAEAVPEAAGNHVIARMSGRTTVSHRVRKRKFRI